MKKVTDSMGYMKVVKMSFLLLFFLGICSCSLLEKEKINNLVAFWEGRVIKFSKEMHFISLERDTLIFPSSNASFTIVSYVDSIGCTSCKLQLSKWKSLIQELDSISNEKIPVLIFMHPKKEKDIMSALKRDNFNYPICIDMKDTFNKLNNFPSNISFQTFLLDREFKVVAIGNPVLNPNIKKLYWDIIQGNNTRGDNESRIIQTKVRVKEVSLFLESFDWQTEKKVKFIFQNIGDKPLVIETVNTSCGCTSVEFDKEPVRPGRSLSIYVTYKADHPGYFNKTITVYCNSESSPIELKISGNAE